MTIVCDTCLTESGHVVQMAGPHSLLLHSGERFEKGDIVYSCEQQGCGRHYEQHHGYFNLLDDHQIVNQRSLRSCQCHEVSAMYISATLADRTVRYRCPCCERETSSSTPTDI